MDDGEIQRIIEQLQDETCDDGGRAVLRESENGEECSIEADRAGLLRLASAVLTAALLPADDEKQYVDLRPIIEPSETLAVTHVGHSETWQPRPAPTPGEKFTRVAYSVGCIGVAVLAVMGGVAVVAGADIRIVVWAFAIVTAIWVIGRAIDAKARR